MHTQEQFIEALSNNEQYEEVIRQSRNIYRSDGVNFTANIFLYHLISLFLLERYRPDSKFIQKASQILQVTPKTRIDPDLLYQSHFVTVFIRGILMKR